MHGGTLFNSEVIVLQLEDQEAPFRADSVGTRHVASLVCVYQPPTVPFKLVAMDLVSCDFRLLAHCSFRFKI